MARHVVAPDTVVAVKAGHSRHAVGVVPPAAEYVPTGQLVQLPGDPYLPPPHCGEREGRTGGCARGGGVCG